MVFTRQIAISGANPESPPITRPETNISKVRNPSRTVFIKEHNEYSQDLEGEDLHYHVLSLNESSTEDI